MSGFDMISSGLLTCMHNQTRDIMWCTIAKACNLCFHKTLGVFCVCHFVYVWFQARFELRAGALNEIAKVPGGAQAVEATAQPCEGTNYPVKLV